MEVNKVRQIKQLREVVEVLSEHFKPQNKMRDVFYAVWEKNSHNKWMIICECYLTYSSEEFKQVMKLIREHYNGINFFCCYVVYLENWKKEKENKYEFIIRKRKR